MSDFQPYKAYTSYGDVMVAYSALKAGGFNPIFQNLNAAQVNMFQALALGGYWIFLPEQEHDEAHDWQTWLRKNPIKDDDTTVKARQYWGAEAMSFILYGPIFIMTWLAGLIWAILKIAYPNKKDTE